MIIRNIVINGRKLSFSEYGPEDGHPVFYFHGFPGSRIEGELLNFKGIVTHRNLRIICPDRPGMGMSDYQPNRTMTSWPKDVLAVATYLGIKHFSIIGYSGGGPYALATALSIPEKLQSVTLIGSMVPYGYPSAKHDISMSVPRQPVTLRKITARILERGTKAPFWMIRTILRILPAVDREFLSRDEHITGLMNVFKEAFRQGVRGYLHECRIYRGPWGFEPSDVRMKITLIHGKADKNVNIAQAKRLAAELPNCDPIYLDGEGHFSLISNHLTAIIEKTARHND